MNKFHKISRRRIRDMLGNVRVDYDTYNFTNNRVLVFQKATAMRGERFWTYAGPLENLL